jgi:WD40 repeat protein
MLSLRGNWFITGGNSGSRPVIGVWDARLADGDIYTHPCGTPKCYVSDVSICEGASKTILMTWCHRNVLCKWDLSVPIDIIEKLQFPSDLTFRLWSEKCNRVLIGNGNGDIVVFLWDQNFPELIRKSWSTGMKDKYKFSPGEGAMLACYGNTSLFMLDCLGLESLFTREWKWNERIGCVQFSPDSETILVSTLNYSTTVECLSTKDGSSIWSIVEEARREDINFWGVSEFSADLQFFPDGKKMGIHKNRQYDRRIHNR